MFIFHFPFRWKAETAIGLQLDPCSRWFSRFPVLPGSAEAQVT